MNSHTDKPWETEMSREFDQRVRDLHEAPLTLDHVKGKAIKIRRTRRVATAAGILAAAAVIVPVGVFAGQGLMENDSGPGPANPTPNPTVIDPDAPGFGYLEGSTLHLADGSTVQLPQGYRGATVVGDTVLGIRSNDDTGERHLDVIDESGTVSDSVEIATGPVANADHTTIAYLEPDGDLVTRWEGRERVIATGLDRNAFPAAVTGGPDCEAGECQVYVNDGAGGAPTRFDSDGGSEVAVPDAIKVNGADEAGLVTVMNKSLPAGSCGGLYDQRGGAYVWETCDSYLLDVSPGSRHVSATHPYLDGIGYGYVTILDATNGAEVARLAPTEGFVGQTVWQDAEHLLATVYDSEGWSIYRLGTDESVERVVGPSPRGDEVTPAYSLLGGS